MLTTIALPDEILTRIDKVIQEGKARSRDEFVAAALSHELAALERRAIDEAFAPLASDQEAQAEASAITREFSQSDWEAFQEAERSSLASYTTRGLTRPSDQSRQAGDR